jgi:hypothetical protein
MKKLLAILLTVAVLLSVCACSKPAETTAVRPKKQRRRLPPKQRLRLNREKSTTSTAGNDEFQARFEKYFVEAGLVPDGVTINWVITPNADNAYQNKLDEALLAQETAAADDKIDLFLIEADYALKYVNTITRWMFTPTSA